MLSRRTAWDLEPNRIAILLEERRAKGELVLDLTESNPTHAGLELPAGAILEAIARPGSLRYEPDPRGLPAARAILAARIGVPSDRIVLTASTSEGYAWLFMLLCDPGDEVLAPVPCYPLCEYLAALEGVRVRAYPLAWDGTWRIDFQALEAIVSERSRAVVVVHPGNPTGAFLQRSELAKLDDLCLRHDLAIVSDEVFHEYGWGEDDRRAGMVALESRAASFSMSGLSKLAGLPQLKLGWIVVGGDPATRTRSMERLEIVADTYLSVATPVQVGLDALLEAGDSIRAQIRARLAENRRRLGRARDREPALGVLPSEGGWYAILEVPRVRSDEEWALELLCDHDVLVQPGYFFDFARQGLLVVSLLTPVEIFEEGVERIARCVGEI